jgi:predicted CxxxxCH...CXXCH cytochrome family protein
VRSRPLFLALGIGFALAACESVRGNTAPPAYDSEIRTLLDARCLRCHADPARGWSAASYTAAIGCGDITKALNQSDHASFASPLERTKLAGWVAAESPGVTPAVHSAGFANPRSPGNHATFLRSTLYRPLIDPNDADACASCHSSDAAPACTTCHTNGVDACGTCHGDGDRAYPPRDRCLFPAENDDRAHATHVGKGISCAACHAIGAHRDGKVDVACTGGPCHAHGGDNPSPAWSDGPLGCNDCHRSPPANHYEGACISCHRVDSSVHVNGKIDLGDGSGKCGACHGNGDDPRPSTGAHVKHPFACETCHSMPAGKHPLGGGARIQLGEMAARGGRRPTYEAATMTCAGTYCHASSTPTWTGPATTCASCHGAPPPPPHTTDTTCTNCHPFSDATHVDGVLEVGR